MQRREAERNRRCSIFSAVLVLLGLAMASSASAAPDCREFAFSADLAAGAAFAKDIGSGLALSLQPEQFSDGDSGGAELAGWRVMVVPTAASAQPQSAEDYIALVNPPLRFKPSQDLGTSYGVTAEEKLKDLIVYPFVLGEDDRRTMAKLAEAVLWPYSAPDPDRATETYLTALRDIPLGAVRFETTHAETTENGKSIRRLSFAVKIIVPDGFALAPALQSAPAECPSREDWP